MRFESVIIAYFVIGAVMWGGGLITWNQTGVGQEFISSASGGEIQVNEETAGQLEDSGGTISEAAETLAGPILIVWNLIIGLLSFVFWPVTVLQTVNAPPQLVVLLGGTMSAGMFVATIRILRGLI